MNSVWENSEIWKDINFGLLTTKILNIKEGVSDSIKKRKSANYMYDITVEDNANYFARDILVHNSGIQRKYDLKEKRFSLFNTFKWAKKQKLNQLQLDILDQRPEWEQTLKEKQQWCPDCCEVVPVLYEGLFDTQKIKEVLEDLKSHGSYAVEGFMNPEGIIVNHLASRKLFKVTCENDEKPKNSKE
jgi:hypothetical protein